MVVFAEKWKVEIEKEDGQCRHVFTRHGSPNFKLLVDTFPESVFWVGNHRKSFARFRPMLGRQDVVLGVDAPNLQGFGAGRHNGSFIIAD